MHNKFFVLSKDGEPVAVWTGSTNISENGIFGHLNVGHSVEDTDVASAYLTYWTQLSGNPPQAAQKQWIDANDSRPRCPMHPGQNRSRWSCPRTPMMRYSGAMWRWPGRRRKRCA